MKTKKQLKAELATALAAVEALNTQVEAAPEAEETPEEQIARLETELAAEKVETARQAKVITDAAEFKPKPAKTPAEIAAAIAKAKALLK